MEESIPTTENSSNEAAVPSAGDVSNKTIVVLVVLTVIISILGTVVTFGEMDTVLKQAPQAPAMKSSGGSQGAQVSLTITEKPVQAGGMVTFEILP